ncbi:unnamed protein product [Danaus chrysippus]|uniref:(African queen) hypothetical protein n=1 Tax=Danaus chrysippus TaxID=151541 RepID=A0A8J2QWH8_9NEOP|nr:unnamed protein product [Danaus chrysippus]
MTTHNVYQKLGHRISEEVQLLAEKKWIIDALAKIKNQRNSLQIERLHLESLKAKLNINTNKKDTDRSKDTGVELSSSSALNLMQNYNSGKKPILDDNSLQVDLNDEAMCNDEELNLGISNMDYGKIENMEEDEESDEENMLIDMNMLMNGTFR